jgi:hypothetical protein
MFQNIIQCETRQGKETATLRNVQFPSSPAERASLLAQGEFRETRTRGCRLAAAARCVLSTRSLRKHLHEETVFRRACRAKECHGLISPP